MKNPLKILTIGSFIFLFAFSIWVRVWGLNSSPPSVDFDEAALGYNAYSLAQTARDEYGNFLPLSLRSFNDYKPALYSYLSIIPIKLAGLNDASTRVVSAVAGILTVIFLFLTLKEFFKGNAKLLLAFSLVAIQPWLIHYSRTAFESNLAAMFFLAGAWLLIKERPLISTFPFALSAYSYHSARLAAPLLILLYLVDRYWPKIRSLSLKTFRRAFSSEYFRMAIPLVIFVLLVSPIFISMRDSLILKRYQQTNIFKVFYPFAPDELLSSGNPWLSMPVNPLYFLGGMLMGHAAAYFSPINLGERIYHTVRFSPMYIPTFGVLGWFETLMVVSGLFFILNHLTERRYRLLLYWILAGVTPAMVTWEWFHPLRSLGVFPALLIISIAGLFFLGDGLRKIFHRVFPGARPQVFAAAVAVVYLIVFIPTLVFVVDNELNYLIFANHGEYQPGGFKEGVSILATLQDKYDKVIIDTPHAQGYIFFLFYQHFSPKIVQSYASVRPSPLTEGDLSFNFYKYEFRKIDWPKDRNLHHVIFWAAPNLNLDDVRHTPGTRIIIIKNAIGTNAAYIITKD